MSKFFFYKRLFKKTFKTLFISKNCVVGISIEGDA